MNLPIITPMLANMKASLRGASTISWMDSTITRMEAASRIYSSRDPKMWELVPRMIGVVDDCVEMNTKACISVPLRLYRVVGSASASERRKYPARRMDARTKSRIDDIYAGRCGQKNAMLADLGGDIEEVTDHPVLDLIRRPNPLFPGMSMAYMRFRNKWAFGEFYTFIVWGSDGTPLKIFPMYPHFTRIQFDKRGYIERYMYGRDQSDAKPYKPDDVIFHKHRPSLSNPLRGESPLASHLPQADIIYKNMMHDIAFVDGGNRPDSVVTMNDPNATDKQVRQIQDRIAALASGAMQSVRALVLRDATWQNISYPPKDLNTEEKMDRYTKQVQSAYGHTESMHESSDANVASVVVGYNAQFMGGTILPALINDASELSDLLLPKYGYYEGDYFFAYDNPVKADEAKEVEIAARMQTSAIATINEMRERLGEKRIDDPAADVLRFNGMSLEMLDKGPQGDATNPLAALFGGDRGGGAAPDTDPDPDGGDTGSDDSGVAPEVTDESPAADEAEKQHPSISVDEKRAIVRSMAAGVRYQDECPACGCSAKDGGITGDADVDRVISDTYPEILKQIRGTLWDMEEVTVQAILNGTPPNLDDQTRALNDLLIDLLMPVVDRSAEMMVQELNDAGMRGVGDGFKPTEAINAYNEHVSLVASDIAHHTEDLIKPAVQRGLELGLSRAEVAEEIANADIPSWRAERIARTESVEALNAGRYGTMKDAGVEMVKSVTAPSPSRAHAVIAKRSPKKIGEPFVKAGEVIEGETIKYTKTHPPYRPNCRCRIEPVIE